MDRPLVLGTRSSPLALWQAGWVADELRRYHAGIAITIEKVSSPGDRLTNISLAAIGGRGLFTRDLDEALHEGRIDLAVHSLKDVPGQLPPGIAIGAVPTREDPADVLVAPPGNLLMSLDDLRVGARVGTDSVRRMAQLLYARHDLQIVSVRGNVDTRLRKLDAGEFDVVVLAAAGLRRLGLGHRISLRLPPEVCLSAPGQGALGITVRSDDPRIPAILAPLHDAPTAVAVGAERALLRRMGGGCQVPLGALGILSGDGTSITLHGVVAAVDGTVLLRSSDRGRIVETESIAEHVAHALLQQGAATWIRDV